MRPPTRPPPATQPSGSTNAAVVLGGRSCEETRASGLGSEHKLVFSCLVRRTTFAFVIVAARTVNSALDGGRDGRVCMRARSHRGDCLLE
jgi:hypothetical protein